VGKFLKVLLIILLQDNNAENSSKYIKKLIESIVSVKFQCQAANIPSLIKDY
jgi:hypothetical protein